MAKLSTRSIYGEPKSRAFGQIIGTLFISSRLQSRLLQRILENAMREYAGRHEETFLAKLHRDLAAMDRQADRENWLGWTDAGRRALEEQEQGR